MKSMYGAGDDPIFEAHIVAPNLSVGSVPPFDLKDRGYGVVVLCAEERQHIQTDIFTVRLPLLDTELPNSQRVSTEQLVRVVGELAELRKKHHVLVTCYAGKNRSAMVAALVLVKGGWTANGAIDRIRKARKLHPSLGIALSNKRFVQSVRAYGRRRT